HPLSSTSSSTLFPSTTRFRSPSSCDCSPLSRGRSRIERASLPSMPTRGRRITKKYSARNWDVKGVPRTAHRDYGVVVPRLDERRSEEHTSELQSRESVVCRLL